MLVTVTVTLNLVYVLLVATPITPPPHRPTCPQCGAAALTFVTFFPPPPSAHVEPPDTS